MEMPDELTNRERGEYGAADNIGELKERMYSRERTGFLPWRRRREVAQERSLVGDDWQYEPPKPPEKPRRNRDHSSYIGASALLAVAVAFFAVASAGAFIYLRAAVGAGTAASVDIVIEGPTSVAAGDVVEFQVLVTNRNSEPLDLADLVVDYPAGTVSPADFKTSLTSERIPLGVIEARSARRGVIRGIFLGQNDTQGIVKVELQYRLKSGNAIHSQHAEHLVHLTTSALALDVDAQRETTSGQEATIGLTIKSLSSTVLNDVVVTAQYPFGYTMKTASPAASSATDSSAVWSVGVLRPGEERTINIAGTLDGQAGDERTIIFTVGVQDTSTDAKPDTLRQILAQNEYALAVKRPFLDVALAFDGGDADEAVAYAGKRLPVVVSWRNNLPVPITDATIAVTLGGAALNKAGVDAGSDGFYRSVDSLLLWDSKTAGDVLKTIPPGANGTFRFELVPLPKSYLEQVRKPALTFAVHAAGKRLSETGVPEVLRESADYTVKVGTDTTFTAAGFYSSNPFGPTGPQPPKVEYETTYAVEWVVTNSSSDVTDAVVHAELPHYVRWIGLYSPSSEQLVYNKVDNTVTWQIGTVAAGMGVGSIPARKVTFVIGLVPSATQIGMSPDIIRNQSFTATDSYTGAVLAHEADAITTDLTLYEDGFDQGSADVVQ